MEPKDHSGMVRRKIVARRLREFFSHILARLSGNSAELVDRAEKRSAAPDSPKSEALPERPP
jgi:hypothetical protein